MKKILLKVDTIMTSLSKKEHEDLIDILLIRPETIKIGELSIPITSLFMYGSTICTNSATLFNIIHHGKGIVITPEGSTFRVNGEIKIMDSTYVWDYKNNEPRLISNFSIFKSYKTVLEQLDDPSYALIYKRNLKPLTNGQNYST